MTQQEIWLVRHALTEENEHNIIIGHSDPPLSKKGILDAQYTAKLLADQPFSLVYTSPLQRAKTTAQIISNAHQPTLAIEESPLLREIHFGIIESLSRDTAHREYPALMEEALNPDSEDFGFPDGELRSEAWQRLMKFLASLASIETPHPILVVTHGGLIGMGLAKAFLLPLGTYRRFQPPHASVTRIRVTYDERAVARISLLGDHPLPPQST